MQCAELACHEREGVRCADVLRPGGLGRAWLGIVSRVSCRRPTSPLSRSFPSDRGAPSTDVNTDSDCWKNLSAPISNTTRGFWLDNLVSLCIDVKSLATDRNDTSRQTAYTSDETDSAVWPERPAALTGRLSPKFNRTRCCAASLRRNNVCIHHVHHPSATADAVDVLRPSTRLLYNQCITTRARIYVSRH